MPKLTIDGRAVEVAAGATVLAAARALGIPIPAVCHREGFDASTSCMVCLVRVNGAGSLSPSCATVVADGMAVESETEAVHAARRTSLELLLSDHAGDCVAPCQLADDRHADLPRFLRQLADGDVAGAAHTLEAAGIDLAEVADGDFRRAEKACRRGRFDGGVAFAPLIRYVAQARHGAGGEEAAAAELPPPYREFSVRLGKMTAQEMDDLLAGASRAEPSAPADPEAGYTDAEARAEARRCLRCDCRAANDCRLRDACEAYGVQTKRFGAERPPAIVDRSHPHLVHEPNKCIRCGLCLQVAERAGERIGLTFTARGFDMRLTVPFGAPLSQALEAAAEECGAVCPTAALWWWGERGEGE